MGLAVSGLAMLLMYVLAMTIGIGRTIRGLKRREPEKAEPTKGIPLRSRILLEVYADWLNIAFVLGTVLYALAARTASWRAGLVLIGLCGLGGVLLPAATWLDLGPDAMTATLVACLERRRARCRERADTTRLRAIEDILEQIHRRSSDRT